MTKTRFLQISIASVLCLLMLAALPASVHADESITLYGVEMPLDTVYIDLRRITIGDNGEELLSALPRMKNARFLDLDQCGLEESRILEIRDAFPNLKVIWRVSFSTGYNVRTDVKTILASYVASYPPHFPGIADSYGFSAAVGSTLLSICMVANSGGKILFGALADKFGAKKIIMLFSLLIGAGALLLMIFHVPGLMYEAAALFGLCYAIANVGTVTATRELAGRKGYNSVYPTVSMIATVANAFGSSLVGFMYDAAGNYNGGLILAAVLTVIMMGLIFSCYVFKKKMP